MTATTSLPHGSARKRANAAACFAVFALQRMCHHTAPRYSRLGMGRTLLLPSWVLLQQQQSRLSRIGGSFSLFSSLVALTATSEEEEVASNFLRFNARYFCADVAATTTAAAAVLCDKSESCEPVTARVCCCSSMRRLFLFVHHIGYLLVI